MQTTDAIWSSVMSHVASVASPEQLDTWFRGVDLLQSTDDTVVISVPNSFYTKWFQDHYERVLADGFERVTGVRPTITYTIVPREPRTEQGPLAVPLKPATSHDPELKLNSNYVFGTFVTGPSNQIAHAASLAVVDAPGHCYNPLFLYGGVGLGKTHLMHAVAYALLKKKPSLRIRYLSCESFMNQYGYAVQHGGISQFRARYRQMDVLLIDDIHILSGREGTQEEFFHTFNELYNTHKQIIISSDSAPEDLQKIQERLISRFKWGLVTQINSPCMETRIAIVQQKAQMRGKILADDVVNFIAETTPKNIRELEGAVLKVIGYSSLSNRPADMNLARQILRPSQPQGAQTAITCERIQDEVSQWYGVSVAEIKGKLRTKSISYPRQVCMYLSRKLTTRSLEEVGKACGGRDHSTVLHACEKIEREAAANQQLSMTLESLIQKVSRAR